MLSAVGRVLVTAIFLAGFAAASQAQVKCAPLPIIELSLLDRFGEVFVGRGVNEGSQIRLYASPGTGSWSLVVMAPMRMACIVQGGEGWEFAKPGKVGKPT